MSAASALYVATAGAGVALGVVGLMGWARPAAGWSRLLGLAAGPGLCALTAIAWGFRAWEAGHLPLFGTYESALSLALAVVAAGVVLDLWTHQRPGLAPVFALVAAALLVHGYRFDATPYALTISERSLAVDLHAVVSWVAFGALTANAALSVRALVVAPGAGGEQLLTRSLELGFFLHTAMLVSGSFYKFLLFGKAWSFDPIETLGMLTWVAYGTLLHLALLGGWRGKRLAQWSLFVFVWLIISYRLIVYFPAWASYHIFDLNLRLHLVD